MLVTALLTAGIFMTTTDRSIDIENNGNEITATLRVGTTKAVVAVSSGFNVYSIEYAGRELLKKPETRSEVTGFMFGTPLLYPTPNRVKKSTFTYEGKKYEFPANDGANFLHGLVHSADFKVVRDSSDDQSVSLEAKLDFKPGTPWFEKFPLEHTLRVKLTVKDGSVTWDYIVDNTAGTKKVPFGFALHPWFLYGSSRAGTFLQVPAEFVMKADAEMLPTGDLLPVKGSKFDLRRPNPLQGFHIDDVYAGMPADKPAIIDFREENLRLTFNASSDFTHLVVYTPAGKPWFCVENQTCSTDAHNLDAMGLKRESHLLVVEPGKQHAGRVALVIEKYKPVE